MAFYRSHVLVSVDPECLKRGAHEVIDALNDELIVQDLIHEVQVLETSRIGDPYRLGPVGTVPGMPRWVCRCPRR